MIELALVGAVVCAAVYLVFRTFMQKPDDCSGCPSQDCPAKRTKRTIG